MRLLLKQPAISERRTVILFVFITFKLYDFGNVFITTLLNKEETPLEQIITRSQKSSSILVAVFFTLWCIEKGWV